MDPATPPPSEAPWSRLHELAAHLQEVREEERRRIARDLHDRLGQVLVLLKIDACTLSDRIAAGEMPSAAEAAAIERGLDEAVLAMRGAIEDLRPSRLDTLGLGAAVAWQVERFQEQTGLEGRARVAERPGWSGGERETALFRALQELLTNVARHARARRVDVTLAACGDAIRLRVEDDGVGFDPASVDEHVSFGLLGIRERIRPWGGSLEIDARSGKGTAVSVRIPITPTNATPP